MRKLDLSKFQIRTDLITESTDESLQKAEKIEKYDYVTVRRLHLPKENVLKKKEGDYVTIEFEDISDEASYKQVKEVLKKELGLFLKRERTLFIGLGNASSTPDAIGPNTVKEVLVTSYLEAFGPLEEGFSSVAAFSPGVTGQTGIETTILIQELVQVYHPEQVVVLDALASKSIKRVCKTIQLSTTGIHPGSGIGNDRGEISEETLGIPVIAIGVPTVVDAPSVVADTVTFLSKKYAFERDLQKSKKNRFVSSSQVDYSKKNITLETEEKQKLFGIIGTLNEEELSSLFEEVLTPIGYNLMITPKEIDFMLERFVHLISSAFNEVMHPKLGNM